MSVLSSAICGLAYLLEDDLSSVQGVLALDGVELLDGLRGKQRRLKHVNIGTWESIGMVSYIVQQVLIAGSLHEVELRAIRVSPGSSRRRGDEEGSAEVVPEQLNSGVSSLTACFFFASSCILHSPDVVL